MSTLESLTQFGIAGLMGVLWIWERMHSRRRERQICETHERLTARDDQLQVLTTLVRHNTRALISFERGQDRMCQLLERINDEMRKQTA
jgi:hypothetical protein